MDNIPRIKKYNRKSFISYDSFESHNGYIDLSRSEIESLLSQMSNNSVVTINIDKGYDGCIEEISLVIYSLEIENDEDYNRRVKEINKAKLMKEELEKKYKEENELRLYEALKKKYG